MKGHKREAVEVAAHALVLSCSANMFNTDRSLQSHVRLLMAPGRIF